MDLEQCPCAGKTLARLLQPAVMALLAARPAHGYDVMRRLRRLAMFRKAPPDIPGTYRLLRTMERSGLLAATREPVARAPARRLYRLTARGRRCLATWERTLESYRGAVVDLLRVLRTAAGAKRASPATRRTPK